MAIEFKRSREDIEADLFRLCEEYGLIRTDRFVSGLVTPIVDVIVNNFSSVYDLENQSRIDTATDEWLASWARIHGQDIQINEGGSDLSFDNVHLATSNNRPVVSYTPNSEPLFLQQGIKALTSDGREVLSTIDPVLMSGSKAYTRVVTPPGLTVTVAPGIYATNIDLRTFAIPNLTEVPNLVMVVQRPITSVQTTLSDDELRAIIYDRARSRNKANNAAVRTVLQFSDVAKVIMKTFNSGSSSLSVYIEPRVGIMNNAMAARIRAYLEELLPIGTRINIGRMVGSIVEAQLKMKLPNGFPVSEIDSLKQNVQGSFISALGNQASGSYVNFEAIISAIMEEFDLPSLKPMAIKVNGRKAAFAGYSCRDIEFLYTDYRYVEVMT